MAIRTRTEFIVVHCSASPPSASIGVREIAGMHKLRGFKTVGYHFVIRRSGKTENGRNVNEVGAHVKGYNDRSVGICLVGGVSEALRPERNFTPEQYDSLKGLIQKMLAAYPNAKVVGHRDLSPDLNHNGTIEPHEWVKECPCFDVIPWWAEQQNATAAAEV